MSLLDTAQRMSSDPALVESQTQARVRAIIRAYRHSWAIYSELIQNSVDAINRRFTINNDSDFHLYSTFRDEHPGFNADPAFRGRIQIAIDVQDRSIEIRDNGVGIEADHIEEFLLPEGSDKRLGQEYGFKGFGLTYAAFISTDFYLRTHFFVNPP